MSQVPATPATAASGLHAELRALIASSRQRLAGAVNAELTRLYWTVGQCLSTEVLGGERASYGSQLLEQLGQQLSHEFGRGLRGPQPAPHGEVRAGFSRHRDCVDAVGKIEMEPLGGHRRPQNPQARQFYAQQAAQDGWSVRDSARPLQY